VIELKRAMLEASSIKDPQEMLILGSKIDPGLWMKSGPGLE
jgi:hypothetical protein